MNYQYVVKGLEEALHSLPNITKEEIEVGERSIAEAEGFLHHLEDGFNLSYWVDGDCLISGIILRKDESELTLHFKTNGEILFRLLEKGFTDSSIRISGSCFIKLDMSLGVDKLIKLLD